MTRPVHLSSLGGNSRLTAIVPASLLMAPAAVLLAVSSQTVGLPRAIALGIGVTIAVEALFLIYRYGARRAATSFLLIAFYTVAALVLRFNSPDLDDPARHALLAVVIFIPIAFYVRREVLTVAGSARRAKFLIRQLLMLREWPTTFEDYRELPLIQALRKVARDNAAPIMPLLAHEDVRVQVAALSALEFHPVWRKDQAEAVLERASYSEIPAVRAAAMMALPNVVKVRHINAIVPFLRDLDSDVRRSAAFALLWDARNRWTDIRGEIRQALAIPYAAKDGPMPCSSNLPPAAIDDFVAWSVESGPVGKRSTQTLLRHCKKLIVEDGSPHAVERVTALVTNARVPPAIRVELAHRLQAADLFPIDAALRLIGTSNPTMLRVFAAGAILSQREDAQAIDVLREAAKQPNREITLAAASLVQRYLSVDMGLPVGRELPPTNSREAAEITRRVQRWAMDVTLSGSVTPADAAVPVANPAYI